MLNNIKQNNSVSLMFAFKVALDREEYLKCKEIKEELMLRKSIGKLNNEIIEATEVSYKSGAIKYNDVQHEVFMEMLEEIKNIQGVPG